ncbi:MAG: UbiD family decarboxylase [Deltaproteobacteria bacterium]|nr:UbiD family decarboxylase [Deltaproteobacteria bacterium]
MTKPSSPVHQSAERIRLDLTLRSFIERIEAAQELKRISGANWDLEIGAITEVSASLSNSKALLFDDINGYPSGFRVITNAVGSQKRSALALGMDPLLCGVRLVRAFKKKLENLKRIPPMKVSTGPVLENIDSGSKVDVLKFPSPKWHREDGGRYIGTMDAVILKDPETGWVNIGTYRTQVHDKATLGVYISPGRHGKMILEKYWAQGKRAPIAVACGIDPILFAVASTPSLAYSGVSEYEIAGGLAEGPVEVIDNELTNLPIPAGSELVFLGESPSPNEESRIEGPFAEWTGYYASGSREEMIVKVKHVFYRKDPIITGFPHFKPFYSTLVFPSLFKAASIWDTIEKAGVPEVQGVWLLESGYHNFIVVSIRQKYAGHSRQAAHAVLGSRSGGYHGRFIVIVDDDVDPSNVNDVLWAIGTRCDPATSFEVANSCWSSTIDPRIPPDEKRKRNFTSSRGIIDACKPFHWIKEFPLASTISEQDFEETMQKWGKIILSNE